MSEERTSTVSLIRRAQKKQLSQILGAVVLEPRVKSETSTPSRSLSGRRRESLRRRRRQSRSPGLLSLPHSLSRQAGAASFITLRDGYLLDQEVVLMEGSEETAPDEQEVVQAQAEALQKARETMWKEASGQPPGEGIGVQEEETARIADHLVFPGHGIEHLKKSDKPVEEVVEELTGGEVREPPPGSLEYAARLGREIPELPEDTPVHPGVDPEAEAPERR
jgi:hypothetical protein